MLKKIKSFGLNLIFALKKIDDMLFSQKSENNEELDGIQENITEERVGQNLLKGEVTQEVADLRYRNYKVVENARCIVVHNDGSTKFLNKEWVDDNFTMINKKLCNSIIDSLNDKLNKYTITIEYEDIPRFRMESYCHKLKVKGKKIELYFLAMPNDETLSKPFLNELERQMQKIEHCDFKTLKTLSFLTQNVNSVRDNLWFKFINLELSKIKLNKQNEYVLTYKASNVIIEDITARYFSDNMELKYQNKTKKKRSKGIIDEREKKCTCEECGGEMITIDGDITEASIGIFNVWCEHRKDVRKCN